MSHEVVASQGGYSTLDDLVAVLMLLNGEHLRPGLGPLHLSERVHAIEGEDYYPHATLPGVYVIHDNWNRLIYIGKASKGATIGIRLHHHFHELKHGGKGPEWNKAQWARSIPVPRSHAFEAPAIEEYLLCRLRTKANRIAGAGPAASE